MQGRELGECAKVKMEGGRGGKEDREAEVPLCQLRRARLGEYAGTRVGNIRAELICIQALCMQHIHMHAEEEQTGSGP